MLKKSASIVLTSPKGSTYHRVRAATAARGGLGENNYPSPLRHWALTDSRPSADVTLIILRVEDLAAALFGERRVLARQGGRVRTDSLFEHPEDILALTPNGKFWPYCWHQLGFSEAC